MIVDIIQFLSEIYNIILVVIVYYNDKIDILLQMFLYLKTKHHENNNYSSMQ